MDGLTDQKANKNGIQTVVIILMNIISVFLLLLGFSILWGINTWRYLRMDELLYELFAPLNGTDPGIIIDYLTAGVLPTLLVVLIMQLVVMRIKRRRSTKNMLRNSFIISFLFFLGTVVYFCIRLDVPGYIKNLRTDSSFIEDNYVKTEETKITFPEKKRNLIYIFLESVEITYADKENGGGFDFNCIPELTEIAKENECFSASDKLNGGVVLPGTSWTIAGMFAQTAGLPLKISIGENLMSTQEQFFPNIRVLGDVLKNEGYRQVLLFGSDADFGGRKSYFTNHGDYEIHDYYYALDEKLIPDNYEVFWGYEDEKLFKIAKEELLELGKESRPFNLTMLTVDTHCEDGYACRLCKDKFGDNKYANVMACSSRQVADFIHWIQKQDFYKNTTIVVCGDHTTMDSNFCDDVEGDYERKTYTAIINSATYKKREGDQIEFSTFDMYPTTLASLGAEIEGERLGLGTNLYSDKKTILEEFGRDYVEEELSRNSVFMEELASIDLNNDELLSEECWNPQCDLYISEYDDKTGASSIVAANIINVPDIKSVYLELKDSEENTIRTCNMHMEPDRNYCCSEDLSSVVDDNGTVKAIAVDENDVEVCIGEITEDFGVGLHSEDLYYLKYVNGTGFGTRINGKRIVISVDNDKRIYDPAIRGEIWNGKDCDDVKTIYFVKAGEGYYETSISLREIEPSDCYIKIFAKDSKTKAEYILLDWHGDVE